MLKEEELSSQQNTISKEGIAAIATADTAPGKYQKRSHLVEAMLYNGNNITSIIEWMKKTYQEHGKSFIPWCYNQKSSMVMVMLEDSEIYLQPNHWLVFGHTNRFYMLPHDLFEDTYEVYDA